MRCRDSASMVMHDDEDADRSEESIPTAGGCPTSLTNILLCAPLLRPPG